jgi:membrane protein required for colicin V production
MTFAFIDVVFALVILFFAITAAFKGFVHELFAKAAFFLGIFGAIIFKNRLAPHLEPVLKNSLFAQIVAFVLIFIMVYLMVRLVQQLVAIFFESDIMSGLNRALGFFLGIAEGLVVVCFALFVLYSQTWVDVSGVLESSAFDRIFSPLIESRAASMGALIPAEL